MAWNISAATSLTGKTFLVTGCTSGIGLYATRYFHKLGANLILAARNPTKLRRLENELTERVVNASTRGSITSIVMDVSNLDSVRNAVRELEQKNLKTIDVLLLNAGVSSPSLQVSAQGYESDFATNHLGHWLLAGLLLPFLRNATYARIVSVSSLMHRFVKEGINYDLAQGKIGNPVYSKMPYSSVQAYSQTKLANLLFVRELNKRLANTIPNVEAVACHPGYAKTNMSTDLTGLSPWKLPFILLARLIMQSAEQGAMPLVMAAIDQTAKPNDYFGPDGLGELKGQPRKGCKISPTGTDMLEMEKLWLMSEQMTGFKYAF